MAIQRKAPGQWGKWRNHAPSWVLVPLVFALAAFAPPARAAFDIYQLPMFSSGTVTPNVMLLVDNSGSMNNIIWADGFDVATTYTWGFNSNEGNYHISEIDGSSCSGGGRWVSKDGKDLCLPNPAGGLDVWTDTRYTGNYLNYLFSKYPDNTVLTGGVIPNETRMQVARTVAKELLDEVTGVRFGLTTFNGACNNSAHGGRVLQPCADRSDTQIANLKSSIDGLTAENNTPLAEALYEITRYFRGLPVRYQCSQQSSSFPGPAGGPLQYRCQKNFTIAITDGFPTFDTDFPDPDSDPADLADTTRALKNWDNNTGTPDTTSDQYPLFPQYSDGFDGSASEEGSTLYLDDIAKFGFDIDMKTTGNDGNDSDTPPQPWGNLSDPAPAPGEPDFRQQNMTTYTVGFATANQMLQDAADYSGGQYFTAKNAAELKAALEEALLDIQTKASAAASVALNSTRLDTNLLIYQARFDGEDWSGDLKAIDVNADGSVGSEIWSAQTRMPAAGARTILSSNADTRAGIPFAWDQLSTGQQNILGTASNWVDPWQCFFRSCSSSWAQNNCSKCDVVGTGNGEDILDYLRGDQSQEEQNGGDFRNRAVILGDIVNSDPQFVGQQDFGYQLLPGSEGAGYLTFRTSAAYTGRPPMVYVGANDGMLHGFDASESGANAGVEKMAYVPLASYQYLSRLADPDYSHRFFVDGSAGFGDAYIDTGSGDAWHTVLVGTMAGGGRGVFALDITDPGSFGAGKVLWDLAVIDDPDLTLNDDGDLGYTYGQPSVVRMANGKWAAVLGNGYNSDNQRAVLFILDLEDGSVMSKIDTGVGSAGQPNGLSSPIPVDIDNDRITDAIYAGDMQGNLWKFDVSGNGAGSWGVAYGGTPLFVATDRSGVRQPITARPEVTKHPVSGVVVLFGTGKYFEEEDRRLQPTEQTQTFYGIHDDGGAVTDGRSALLEQELIEEIASTDDRNPSKDTDNPVDVRVTTEKTPTEAQKGWYFDLPTTGERQVSKPIVRDRRVIFTTVIPNDSACFAGGTSWLMEMDSVTGSRLPFSPFDLNNDQQINGDDYVEITTGDGELIRVPVSGKKSNEGVIKTPGIVGAGDLEYKYTSGTTGGIEVTVEPGNTGSGRQSWRQLQ